MMHVLRWRRPLKTAEYGYVWLYGCRPKSVCVGLGCTPALSVTHSAAVAAVCGLWRYISTMPFVFRLGLVWSAEINQSNQMSFYSARQICRKRM